MPNFLSKSSIKNGVININIYKNEPGGFRANGAFSQRSLSIFGNPEVSREADNLGTAMLFEPRRRDVGASSATAENAKELWRARRAKAT